jgi:uncharacterized membrane protein
MAMTARLKSSTNVVVQGVIQFLQAQGITPTQIHRQLVTVWVEHVMSKKQVFVWCKAFQKGTADLTDEP